LLWKIFLALLVIFAHFPFAHVVPQRFELLQTEAMSDLKVGEYKLKYNGYLTN
jgi:hypothetical protein